MNLLKSTFLVYVSALYAVVNAQDDPPLPNLNGENFKITVIENVDYQVKVSDTASSPPTNEDITGYMIDMIDATAHKANFTYELIFPSGKGVSCDPRLEAESTGLYGPAYRSQFNCGQEDVYAGDSDMYWSLYYISPFRQLRNQFTIPYRPPVNGALTMYGIGEGVKNFEDLIAQQKEGTQGPICLGTNTAYGNYLTASFPELKYVGVPNTDAGALNGIKDGLCNITVNAYPYALDFIANRKEAAECEINGKSVGVIGEPLGFGLTQFGVGIRESLPTDVTSAISYWLNILMTCAPGSTEESCVTKDGKSLYEDYVSYGRSDPNLCRPSALDFIGDLFDTVGGIMDENSPEEGGTDAEPAPVPAPDPNPGSGRKLGAAAAGVLGAILGRLF